MENFNDIMNAFVVNITLLGEKCNALELENVKVKTENVEMNKFCEYLLKEIDDLKSIIKNNSQQLLPDKTATLQLLPDKTATLQHNNFEFDAMLNDYEINGNETILIELFDKFPEKHKYILTAIRDNLPKDISILAEEYHFQNDLDLLLKSNELIQLDDQFEKSGMHELVDKYIKNFNANKKNAAYRYVREALLCYPLTYKEQFLNKIQAYLFDDFEESFNKILTALYGNRNDTSTSTINEIKRKYTDYSTESVENLINSVKGRNDMRYTALRIINSMSMKKRSNIDINNFISEINKFLKKKIELV